MSVGAKEVTHGRDEKRDKRRHQTGPGARDARGKTHSWSLRKGYKRKNQSRKKGKVKKIRLQSDQAPLEKKRNPGDFSKGMMSL